MSADPMNVEGVLDKLRTALTMQLRSVIELNLLAGSQTGLDAQPLAPLLSQYAQAELDDTRRLVEKMVALGGVPPSEPAPYEFDTDGAKGLATLLDHEEEALDAIHAIIPESGQEPRSEALEHRVEHIIMRKQEQVDTLRRALGQTTT